MPNPSKLAYRVASSLPLALSCAVLAGPAPAQNAQTPTSPAQGPEVLEEILVTAQHREERAQDVPIAISAIGGAQAEAMGIQSTVDLQVLAPALTFGAGQGGAVVAIRGVSGTNTGGDESPNAVYLDGVYMPSTPGLVFGLSNVERIEVLKGPQGTLFGRNASGGAIQIITRNPSFEPRLDASFGLGNYRTGTAEVYGSTGLTENVAVDISLYAQDQGDGWGTNLFSGQPVHLGHDFSGRMKFLWNVSEDTRVILAAMHSSIASASQQAYVVTAPFDAAGAPAAGWNNSRSEIEGVYEAHDTNVAATVTHNFDWATLTSISAVDSGRFPNVFDQDATASRLVDARLERKAHVYTQELRLNSAAESKLIWSVGAFYFNNLFEYDPQTIRGNANFTHTSELHTKSYAGYGQVTYPLGPTTNLTGGVRYTKDDQSFAYDRIQLLTGVNDIDTTADDSSSKWTYRVSLDQHLGANAMVYAAYNTGFKSGLFNLSGPTNPYVRPQFVEAYEVGAKSELFARRLRVNVAAYDYDFTNVQVRALQAGFVNLINGAKARVKGGDLDAQMAATDNLTLLAAAAYSSGEYKSFPGAQFYAFPPLGGLATLSIGDATGNETIQTPKWVYSAGFLYKIQTSTGMISLNGNWLHNDGFFWDPQNIVRTEAYELINASIGWTSMDGKYDAKLWGKNLDDAEYCTQKNASAFGPVCYPAAPRTFGVTFGVHF